MAVFVAARLLLRLGCAPRLIEVGPPPNKPMQPTANSAAFMCETWMLDALCARRLIGGVMSPLHVESTKSPAAPQLNAIHQMWLMRTAG